MTTREEEVDKILEDMFGSDPAGQVMAQPKVPFSLTAAPVKKTTTPTSEPDPATTVEPSPFIVEPPTTSKITDDGNFDWSENAKDLVDVVDIIQTGVFGFVAGAKPDEADKVFGFSTEAKVKLSRLSTPVAQKHNIKVPKELSLIITLGEQLARNTDKALDMRKDKNDKAAEVKRLAQEDAETKRIAASKTVKLEVVKEAAKEEGE